MIYLGDIFLTLVLFSFFGLIHSFLASRKLKDKLAEKIGDSIAFYRLFYNFISLITFIAAYSLSPKPDVIIYDLDSPFDIIIFAVQVLSLMGLYWVSRYINMKEFLGINQIKRFMADQYDIEDRDEKLELINRGPFKIVRHPVYFFAIIFLGARPQMDLFYLVFFVCMTAYFIAGSYFEEKKLVKVFGQKYIDYQNNVPRIFPKIF